MAPPQNQIAQESFGKYGQLPRKPLNPGAPMRNQNQQPPIRPSPAQNASASAKPDTTNGTSAAAKSPSGDVAPGGYQDGNERGILRRGDREQRGVRGTGMRGGLTRANGAGPAMGAGQGMGKVGEAGKVDAVASAPTTATTDAQDASAASAASAEDTAKTAAPAADESKTEKVEEGWGAATATTTTAAATGLPPARTPRLVEKNPHTLYVKGLPQPCTDEELRGLWKEDVRAKVRARGSL